MIETNRTRSFLHLLKDTPKEAVHLLCELEREHRAEITRGRKISFDQFLDGLMFRHRFVYNLELREYVFNADKTDPNSDREKW